MNIQVKLSKDAKMPTKSHQYDAGFDLFTIEPLVLEPGKTTLVSTGVYMLIPPGYEGQIRSRSGYSLKGIVVASGVGTIDAHYTGEILIPILNRNETSFQVPKNTRIAQLVLSEVPQSQLVQVDELHIDTDRGDKGFGSTDLATEPSSVLLIAYSLGYSSEEVGDGIDLRRYIAERHLDIGLSTYEGFQYYAYIPSEIAGSVHEFFRLKLST